MYNLNLNGYSNTVKAPDSRFLHLRFLYLQIEKM